VNFFFVNVAIWPSSHSCAMETSELFKAGKVKAALAFADRLACGRRPL